MCLDVGCAVPVLGAEAVVVGCQVGVLGEDGGEFGGDGFGEFGGEGGGEGVEGLVEADGLFVEGWV